MNDPVPMPAWPRYVLTGVWVGLVVLTVALTLLFGVAFRDAFTVSVLFLGLPGIALVQVPALRGVTIERIPAYLSSIGTLVLIGALSMGVGAWGRGLEWMGWVPLPVGPMLAWTAGLTAAGLGIVLVFRGLGLRFGWEEHRILRDLIPRTRREKRVFFGLSLAAGWGEEAAYRGYAIPLLTPWLGPWGAAVFTSLVFGAMHVYQGVIGIVRTALMGGVLAWGFLASGSLLPAVAAHALIDVIAGIFLADRLMVPEGPSGVPEGPDAAPSSETD